MSIKVSIIVPVYNTEKYLNRCLETLVNQTLEEIEIILVNDCSNDNSLSILNEYKGKYPDKIKVIDLKENRGPGGARNAGLKAAKGKYIGFVDSDDDVSYDMFKELYETAEKGNHDMVDCRFYNEVNDTSTLTTDKSAIGNLNLEKKKELFLHSGFIWSKIIKRNVITNNKIKFREKAVYEDIDFIRLVIVNCKKVSAVDKALYNYRNNENSITNSFTKEVEIYERMEAMRFLVKKFKEIGEYIRYKDEITYIIYKTYAAMINYAMTLEKERISFEIFKELHDFFFEVINYNYQNNKYISQVDQEDKMFAEINNIDYKKISSMWNNLVS